MTEIIGLFCFTLLVVFAFLVALGLPFRQIDHHYSVSNCYAFAQQTGREVKFADYNFLSYECLAKTADGHYLPTTQLRDVTN